MNPNANIRGIAKDFVFMAWSLEKSGQPVEKEVS
jgi:hypothetical protein